VYRWDFRSGDLKRLASIPIPDQSTAQTTLSSLSRLYILTGTEPPMACEVQDPLGRGLTYGRSSTIRVLDLSDNGRIVSEMTGGFWGGVAPVFLPDNSTFFIRMWGGESDIGLWSLKDGSFVGGLAAPGFMGTLQDGPAGLAYHGPSHRLFVATCDEVVNVHVRDTASKKWIATLSTDFRGLPDSQIALSPDGRWVAIKVVKLTPKGGGQRGSTGQDRLLIFDLAGMNAVEKAAPDPDSP
jgi:WD40 repeat protein